MADTRNLFGIRKTIVNNDGQFFFTPALNTFLDLYSFFQRTDEIGTFRRRPP